MSRWWKKADDSILIAVGVIAAAIVGGVVVYYYTSSTGLRATQMVPDVQAKLRNHEQIDIIKDHRGRITSIIIDREVQ